MSGNVAEILGVARAFAKGYATEDGCSSRVAQHDGKMCKYYLPGKVCAVAYAQNIVRLVDEGIVAADTKILPEVLGSDIDFYFAPDFYEGRTIAEEAIRVLTKNPEVQVSLVKNCGWGYFADLEVPQKVRGIYAALMGDEASS